MIIQVRQFDTNAICANVTGTVRAFGLMTYTAGIGIIGTIFKDRNSGGTGVHVQSWTCTHYSTLGGLGIGINLA